MKLGPIAALRLRRAGETVLAFFLAAGLGFVWFLHLAAARPVLPSQADGIVVLTGGPERIEAGLQLLAAGRATQLLISGVGRGPKLAEFTARAGLDPVLLGARIMLGRMATSTRTNAEETRHWAQDKTIRSLVVVTADYHMPRALVELGRAMPDITLHPAPVTLQQGLAHAPSWRRLAGEYVKWVLAQLGLSRYGRTPPPVSGDAPSITNGPAA
ncbi:MAG: YdcF family protein [Acetobacteraceae bacterium]|nr:YdcF family protein [Acetobacteraceae bacterium]